jgi:hypothetical protein
VIAALVWMIEDRVTLFVSGALRPTAETMPSVTLERSPSGLPIASVRSPTSTWAELAKVAGRGRAPVMRITARSVLGSLPTRVAGVGVARGERDHEARRVIDDVRVGDHVAASVEDDARAQC